MTKRRIVVKALLDDGWVMQSGKRADHDKFVKPGKRSIPVPRHRELDDETAKIILRQAGLR